VACKAEWDIEAAWKRNAADAHMNTENRGSSMMNTAPQNPIELR
jgi:hypothetical protein